MYNAKKFQQKVVLVIAFAIAFGTSVGAAERSRMRPLLCGSISSSNIPTLQLSSAELDALARREVVLIVDKSSSMACKDCEPPKSTEAPVTAFEFIAAQLSQPISRWDWCFRQVGALVEQLHSVSKDGITVVMFDSKFTTSHHSDAADVVRAFENARPGGRTELAPALQSQLALHAAKRWGSLPTKPLLVAVLTDGYSNDVDKVREMIQETSNPRTSREEVQIIFVNVGRNQFGTTFLHELDTRFETVRCVDFREVSRDGLARKLAAVAMASRPM